MIWVLLFWVLSTVSVVVCLWRGGHDVTVGDFILAVLIGWAILPLYFICVKVGHIFSKVIIKGRE